MRILKSLAIVACLLALAGASLAVELQDTVKFPVKKAPVEGGTAALGTLDCSGAVEVDLNVGVYNGDTTGAPNNVSTYGCSTWNESGGEVVFHVTFPADVTWQVGLSGMTGDLDLAVLDACDETTGCLGVFDTGVYVAEPYPGELWFVVDGYSGAVGPFTLTFTTTPYSAPPSMCDLVQNVTGTSFTGDTCNGYNNVSAEACGDYTENGLEHYYEILMPAGCSFTANVKYATKDGALWLLDSCAAGYACIGYADDTVSGGTETLSYTNTSGATQTVYLVIDSWGTAACGTYQFDFVSLCSVPTETTNFGSVKSLFR